MLFKVPVEGDGYGREMNNVFETMLKDQGFTRTQADNWVFKARYEDGSESTLYQGVALDVTDMFFAFEGLDRKGFLGNKGQVSDKLFFTIHGDYIKGAQIHAAQAFLDPDRGVLSEDAVKKIRAEARRSYLGAFGFSEADVGRGDLSLYDARLVNALQGSVGALNIKVTTALNWRFDTQNEISNALKWGFYDQTSFDQYANATPAELAALTSSLCVAESFIQAYEMSVLEDVPLERKIQIYKKLAITNLAGTEFDSLDTFTGTHMVGANGEVDDAWALIMAYAKAAETITPNGSDMGVGRFGECRNLPTSSHSSVWDYSRGGLFYDPYVPATGHTFTQRFRISTKYDLLSYDFWSR
jgi:hypothetical protein